MITPKTGVCPTPPPNKISRGVMMFLIAYFPSSDKKGVSQVADANLKPFLTSPLLIRGRAHLQYSQQLSDGTDLMKNGTI